MKVRKFIAYHSTNTKIDDFDFNKIELKSNTSMRINVLYQNHIIMENLLKLLI